MKEFSKLVNITRKLKDVYPDLTVRQLQIFLEVYYEEGNTQFSYAKKCGESEALVSRTVDRLGDKLALITLGKTPDNRSKALFISPAGRELIQSLIGILKDDTK